MKYYKDNLNNVYAYESDGSQDHLIGDKFAMTDAEVQEHLHPTPTLAELQAQKIQALYTSYNTDNQADIAYMSTTFQADKASQDLIVSVLSAGSVPTGFYWLDKLNAQIAMTYAELQGLSGAILARGQINFTKLQTLKAQVNAATTQAELDSIVW